MKKSKKATSIVEAIIVLMIITTGVTGMYTLFNKSQALAKSTANKIQAIQIAKQGIEAFTNIRDTNWIKFSSDYKNCWNTDITKHSVGNTCVGDDDGINYDIIAKSYIIYRDTNNSWIIKPKDIDTFGSGTYNSDYRVGLDDGIYTQSGAINNLQPMFTREIIISYIEDTDSSGGIDSNDEKMKVISLVQWIDSSSSSVHKVELEQILSNRKK